MKTRLLISLPAGLLLLAACAPVPEAPTQNVALIQTSAAQTVVANFTLTAASFTRTPLPPPSDTPAPTPTGPTATGQALSPTETPTLLPGGVSPTPPLCDYYSWGTDVDVNVPDNTEMTPGQDFVKTWKIQNAGTCTWGAGYKIVYAGYTNQMSGVPQPLSGVVQPGQQVEVSVNFKAPTAAGVYVSAWTLQNSNGKNFFGLGAKPLYVKIVVKL